MATRQDTSKTPEQQSRQPEQSAKQSEQMKTAQSRPTETGITPYRGGAPAPRAGGRDPILRLRDEFDRLFDQFSRGWLGVPVAGGWGIDVREDDNNVIVRAEAPGFDPADFDIQVRGDQLVMCACHKGEEQDEGYRGWRRNEFYEALALPSGADADKVKAAYRQGVLIVTLPKAEDGRAKRITVQG